MTTRLHVELTIDVIVAAKDELCGAAEKAFAAHQADAVPPDRRELFRSMYANDPAAAFGILLDVAVGALIDGMPGVEMRAIARQQVVPSLDR